MPLSEAEERELAELKGMFSQLQREEQESSPMQTAQDFARGVGSGATLGFLDELSGAAGALVDPQNLGGQAEATSQAIEQAASAAQAQDPNEVAAAMRAEGFSDQDINEQLAFLAEQAGREGPSTYDVYRDRARRLQEEAGERSPIATGAGELVGALGTGGAIGARSIPALMGEGAAFGLGSAEGTAGEQLASAALGAGTAGVLGGAGRAAGKVVDAGKRKLAKAAERKAVDALGATASQRSKLFDADRVGREILDEGIAGVGRSKEKMLTVSEKKLSQFGDKLDEMYDAAGGVEIPKLEVARRIMERGKELEAGGVGNKAVADKVKNFARQFAKQADTNLTPKALRREKKAIGNINFESQAEGQVAKRAMRSAIKDVEDEALASIGAGKEFIDLKRKVGDLQDIKDILSKSEGKQRSKIDTLIDYTLLGGGAAGSASTDDPTAAGLATAIALGRRAGPGGQARILDMLSKAGSPVAAGTAGRAANVLNPYLGE